MTEPSAHMHQLTCIDVGAVVPKPEDDYINDPRNGFRLKDHRDAPAMRRFLRDMDGRKPQN